MSSSSHRARALLRRLAPWLAVGVIALALLTQARVGTSLPEGQPAPELSVDLSDGTTLSLGQARDSEIVVLTFWATWCPACRQEAPGLSRLHDGLSGRGARVVGLAVQQGSLEAIAMAARRIGMRYPVAVASPEQIRAFQVDTLPTTYVVDRGGSIRWSRIGGVSEDDLREVVEGLL